MNTNETNFGAFHDFLENSPHSLDFCKKSDPDTQEAARFTNRFSSIWSYLSKISGNSSYKVAHIADRIIDKLQTVEADPLSFEEDQDSLKSLSRKLKKTSNPLSKKISKKIHLTQISDESTKSSLVLSDQKEGVSFKSEDKAASQKIESPLLALSISAQEKLKHVLEDLYPQSRVTSIEQTAKSLYQRLQNLVLQYDREKVIFFSFQIDDSLLSGSASFTKNEKGLRLQIRDSKETKAHKLFIEFDRTFSNPREESSLIALTEIKPIEITIQSPEVEKKLALLEKENPNILIHSKSLENHNLALTLVPLTDFMEKNLSHINIRTLSLIQQLRIISSLCDILEKLHSSNLIHRKIEPSNILIHLEKDPFPSVYLINFSLASAPGLSNLVGSCPYWDLCTEYGYVSTFSDLYGLAITLAELSLPYFYERDSTNRQKMLKNPEKERLALEKSQLMETLSKESSFLPVEKKFLFSLFKKDGGFSDIFYEKAQDYSHTLPESKKNFLKQKFAEFRVKSSIFRLILDVISADQKIFDLVTNKLKQERKYSTNNSQELQAFFEEVLLRIQAPSLTLFKQELKKLQEFLSDTSINK